MTMSGYRASLLLYRLKMFFRKLIYTFRVLKHKEIQANEEICDQVTDHL